VNGILKYMADSAGKLHLNRKGNPNERERSQLRKVAEYLVKMHMIKEGNTVKITKKQLKSVVKEAMRYDFGSDAGDKAIAAHANKKELKALSFAFTYQVVPEDISYITYQPRKRGGVVTRIDMEDREDQLGNMETSINESEANSYGTTVAKLLDFLAANGARQRRRRPRRKTGAGHSFSYYD